MLCIPCKAYFDRASLLKIWNSMESSSPVLARARVSRRQYTERSEPTASAYWCPVVRTRWNAFLCPDLSFPKADHHRSCSDLSRFSYLTRPQNLGKLVRSSADSSWGQNQAVVAITRRSVPPFHGCCMTSRIPVGLLLSIVVFCTGNVSSR